MNRIATIFAAGLMCVSAAYADDDDDVKDGPDTRALVHIGAQYIENKTDDPKANFKGMIDRLDFSLSACGVYRVINEKSLGDGMKNDEKFSVAADDGGKKSNVSTPDMLVYLTIMQYGFAKTAGTDMYGQSSATQQAKIELILKVVDARTKETLGNPQNISRSATGTATATANLTEQVLQTANKQVVDDIVDALVKLTPFNVLDVENGEVVVDVPSTKVKPGQQLTVLKKGKKIKNKRTGKVTAKESQVATIGVQTLSEDSVTCKLLTGEIKPDEDAEEGCEYDKYVVRIPTGAPQAPAVVPVAAPAPATAAAPF